MHEVRKPNGPSQRSRVSPFLAMDVLRAANRRDAEGASVMHLEVGQPGTPAPRSARQAALAALETDQLGYTEALGRPALRNRIARYYGEHYGIDLDPARVIVTTGSSAGFMLTFLALFDRGMRVAITDPGYPAYRNVLTALDLDVASVPVRAAEGWRLDAAKLDAFHSDAAIDGLLIASPANPTGTMLTPEGLGELIRYCGDNGIRFISDEIYHGLTYGQPETSALATSDDVIVINSFSKYFSMTGWRVGWMIVPPDLERVFERLAQNLFICPPALSQVAAEAAFDDIAELNELRDVYRSNRDTLMAGLARAGLDRIAPADGAFYLYADVSSVTNDSAEFAQAMLNEIAVAATPGLDFDPENGSAYLRFSYAGSPEHIEEAVRRIEGWLGS